MATAGAGRGRGRGKPHVTLSDPPPSISSASSVVTTSQADTATSLSPATNLPAATATTIPEQSPPHTGPSSSATIEQPTTVSRPTPTAGRGRLKTTKSNQPPPPSFSVLPSETVDAHDPYWTVSNFSNPQFYSVKRAPKPDELGKIGRQIEVIANYFRILQFPQHGLVYRYHIQMRDKRNEEMHRDRRR